MRIGHGPAVLHPVKINTRYRWLHCRCAGRNQQLVVRNVFTIGYHNLLGCWYVCFLSRQRRSFIYTCTLGDYNILQMPPLVAIWSPADGGICTPMASTSSSQKQQCESRILTIPVGWVCQGSKQQNERAVGLVNR